MKVVQSTVLNVSTGSARRLVNAMTNVAIRVDKYRSEVSGARSKTPPPISIAHILFANRISIIPYKIVTFRGSAVIVTAETRQRTRSMWDGNSAFHTIK